MKYSVIAALSVVMNSKDTCTMTNIGDLKKGLIIITTTITGIIMATNWYLCSYEINQVVDELMKLDCLIATRRIQTTISQWRRVMTEAIE